MMLLPKMRGRIQTVTGAAPVIAAAPTQLVANGAALNYTPTLVQGSGITWTATGLPAGASVSSTTGALTGTLSTNGQSHIQLTATNGYGTDYVLIPVVVYGSTSTIDSAWLADSGNQVTANSRTCYVLKVAHRLYTLDANLSTPGTAFYVAAANCTLNLNGKTVTYNTDGFGATSQGQHNTAPHGIVTWIDFHNTEAVISGGANGTKFTLLNGTVKNTGDFGLAHCWYGFQADGHAAENVTLETIGKDSHCIYFQWSGTAAVYLNNNHLVCGATTSFNRHQGPGAIGYKPVVNAQRNVIIGGNSAVVCSGGSTIRKNLLSHSCAVTNGYGVWLYQFSNCTITDNLMLPTNGRGVLLNGYGGGDGQVQSGNAITNNVILHFETPNAEFGEALNPPAVRMRYVTGGNTFSGNTCLGLAGDTYTSASSIYLTDYGDLHTANTFENNILTTIILQDPISTTYCQPITMEGQGCSEGGGWHETPTGGALDIIRDNVCRSNCYLVRTSGYDGVAAQKTPLTGNTFEYVTGAAAYTDFAAAITAKYNTLGLSSARATNATAQLAVVDEIVNDIVSHGLKTNRAFLFPMYYSVEGATSHADLIDSTYGSGVDSKSYQYVSLYAGTVLVRDGFTRQIRIMDGSASVNNTNCTVTSDAGDVATVTTDGNGYVTVTFYRWRLTKAAGASDPLVMDDIDQSTVAVAGYATPATVLHSAVPTTIDIGSLN